MLKRIARWMLRSFLLFVLLVIVGAISDYFSHRVKSGSVLIVALEGEVVERGNESILGVLRGRSETPLNVVRAAIHQAATDPRIEGLAIKVLDPELHLAQAQEITGLMREFGSHGKWTTAYIESAGESAPGNAQYLVASAAGEVSMMPDGELNLVGLQIRELFGRGALDWLGVKADMHSIGAYKSAANMYTEKDFTPAQREEDEALINSLFGQLVGQIASQRKLDRETVRSLIDRAPLSPSAGISAHLIDRLEYEDQFNERLKNRGGKHHDLVEFTSYRRPRILPSLSHPDRIAVVYGVGEIQRGAPGFDPVFAPSGEAMGSDDIADAFERAREDDSVRAVVFRVDSPGGSVLGSELIRRQVELTAEKKPVVISMGSYAASGGYWISTPAARIFAEPATITGSIGVLGGKFNVAGAAAKLGVNSGAIARGANVNMFDSFTDYTPAQQALFKDQILGDIYKRFLGLVAKGRRMPLEQVEKVAQGRVWTGEQALSLKLVDAIGDLQAAMNEAKSMAKLPADRKLAILELPRQPGLLTRLMGGLDAQAQVRAIAHELKPLRGIVRALVPNAHAGALYCPRVPVM